MRIPAEAYIPVLLRQGNVFYFDEPSFREETSHNFVLLNSQPTPKSPLVLVWATSKIEKVRRFRREESSSTVVIVRPNEYQHFTKETAFDCNECLVKSCGDLIQLANERRLKHRAHVGDDILGRLIQGLLNSRLIPFELKTLVDPGICVE